LDIFQQINKLPRIWDIKKLDNQDNAVIRLDLDEPMTPTQVIEVKEGAVLFKVN